MVVKLIRLLTDVGLELSLDTDLKAGKSHAITSAPNLDAQLAEVLQPLGLPVATTLEYLGTDLRKPGKKQAKANKRETTLSARCQRIAALSLEQPRKTVRAGMQKVIRSGLKKGYQYGATVRGMPDSKLQRYRSRLAKAAGKRRSASLTIFLDLTNLEPQHELATAAIYKWAAAIWDETEEKEVMQKAWKRQWPQHGLVPKWRAITGPAGTLATYLARIQWKWPAWNVFLTPQGQTLDCTEVCPSTSLPWPIWPAGKPCGKDGPKVTSSGSS